MNLSALLLADYNVYRRQTKHAFDMEKRGVPFRAKRMDSKTQTLFDELQAWCRERHLEPRLWLFGLFKARNWGFAPQLKSSHLCSENMLKKYKRLKGLGFFSRRRRVSNVAMHTDEDFDPNRDLDATAEALKKRFIDAGQPMRCLEALMTQTLGYHPRSRVCARCPLAPTCVVELQCRMPFDVVGLRLGRKTSAQCQLTAQKAATHDAADS